MSLEVNRIKKQGEMIFDGRVWDILRSNALFCAFSRKKDKPESWDDYWTGWMYTFMFSDDQHMKRVLGLVKNSDGEKENLFKNQIEKITFYRNMWEPSDLKKIICAFALASGNITIEVKESDAE